MITTQNELFITYYLKIIVMLNVKDSIKRLISNIYECQKHIIINRRFINDLIMEGQENNISGLQHEIISLQEKIIEFQKELRERFKYSY